MLKKIKEFNTISLSETWNKYAEQYRDKSPTLSVSMLNKNPEIDQEGKIVITIENELQKTEFVRNLDNLRQHLTSEFGSRVYDFNFNMVEPEFRKTVFTDSDKLKHFAENYPYFDNFRKRFGLEAV